MIKKNKKKNIMIIMIPNHSLVLVQLMVFFFVKPQQELRIYGGDGINTDGADDELDYGAGGPEATDQADFAKKNRGF